MKDVSLENQPSLKGKALADAFNDFFFVNLVNSVHSVEASKYVKYFSDSIFLSPTSEDEVI